MTKKRAFDAPKQNVFEFPGVHADGPLPPAGYWDSMPPEVVAVLVRSGGPGAQAMTEAATAWRTLQESFSTQRAELQQLLATQGSTWDGTAAATSAQRFDGYVDWLGQMADAAGDLSNQATAQAAAYEKMLNEVPSLLEIAEMMAMFATAAAMAASVIGLPAAAGALAAAIAYQIYLSVKSVNAMTAYTNTTKSNARFDVLSTAPRIAHISITPGDSSDTGQGADVLDEGLGAGLGAGGDQLGLLGGQDGLMAAQLSAMSAQQLQQSFGQLVGQARQPMETAASQLSEASKQIPGATGKSFSVEQLGPYGTSPMGSGGRFSGGGLFGAGSAGGGGLRAPQGWAASRGGVEGHDLDPTLGERNAADSGAMGPMPFGGGLGQSRSSDERYAERLAREPRELLTLASELDELGSEPFEEEADSAKRAPVRAGGASRRRATDDRIETPRPREAN